MKLSFLYCAMWFALAYGGLWWLALAKAKDSRIRIFETFKYRVVSMLSSSVMSVAAWWFWYQVVGVHKTTTAVVCGVFVTLAVPIMGIYFKRKQSEAV